MTPKRLLDYFDRISDAPDAIPRLRLFILDLAVRGKLVEQDPNDEPASELIKQIQAQKQRSLKNSKINQQLLPSLNDSDVPFSVPDSWAWIRLDILAEKITDGEHLSPNKTTSGMLLLTATHVTAQGLTLHNPQFVSIADGHKLRQRCDPKRDDILICSRGTIGRCAVVNTDETFCLMGSVILVRMPKDCSSAYFNNFLTTDRAQVQMAGMSGATAVHALYLKDIRLCPVAVPPVAEQHRIVAKVDELMALCDRLESAQAEREGRRGRLVVASLHRLNNGADANEFREHVRFHLRHLTLVTTRPEHIQQLRQTILNFAVRGKLVPQDPNDEPASELLKRIQAEKSQLLKKGAIKRTHVISTLDTAKVPAPAPDGWEWVKLGDLLLGDSQNGYSKKPDDGAYGIPILRISAGTLRRDGIVAEEEHKLISGVSTAQKEQYELRPGDLLACRFNGNRSFVGRLSLYLGYLGIRPIYPDKLIRLRLLSQFVVPKLVRCFAESNVVRKEIETYCATTVGNWGISASNLKDVKFPLPPLAEQHRIVAKVDELLGLCDRLEGELTTDQTESRRLLEAVLQQALGAA